MVKYLRSFCKLGILVGLSFSIFGTTSVAGSEKDLVTYFALNEGKGDVTFDQLGRKGIISGAEWVQDKFGPALSFKGKDSYVEIKDIEGLDGNNEITIEAWIKCDNLGDPKHGPVFLSHGRYKKGGWYLYIKLGGRVVAVFSNPGTVNTLYSAAGVVSAGKWSHIAVTAVKNGEMKIYVDGVEAGSRTMVSNWAPASLPLYIGKYSSPGFEFNGLVDEVKIYNRVLAKEEIQKSAGVQQAKGDTYNLALGKRYTFSFPPNYPYCTDKVVYNIFCKLENYY